MVKSYLEKGGEVDLREQRLKTTPLHLASQGGYDDIVRLLLEHGADVNAKNIAGMTPLHFALCPPDKHISTALILIANKAVLDTKALDYAASINDPLITRILFLSEVEDEPTPHESAVHSAALAGTVEVIKELIKNNSHLNHEDVDGTTSLNFAQIADYAPISAERSLAPGGNREQTIKVIKEHGGVSGKNPKFR